MARTWTDEQKKAASERARAARAPAPAADELFQAQHAPREETTGNYHEANETNEQIGMSRTGPGFVTLYKPTDYGYFPRKIPVMNMAMLMQLGYKAHCPDCGGDCGTDENSCPGRPKRAYRDCPHPACKRRIYDHPPLNVVETNADPLKIQDSAYAQSTPELRTQASMDAHIISRHESLARTMGLLSRQPAGV